MREKRKEEKGLTRILDRDLEIERVRIREEFNYKVYHSDYSVNHYRNRSRMTSFRD